MLYQELPQIESTPLDGWVSWLAPALIVAAAATRCRATLVAGNRRLQPSYSSQARALQHSLYLKAPAPGLDGEVLRTEPDYTLVGSALGLSSDPIALTRGEGSLLIVNSAYRERFGGAPPPLGVAASDEARQGLKLAQTMAWRDGAGCVAAIETELGNNARRSRTRRRPQRPTCLAVHKIRCTRSDQCRHEPLARPRLESC